MRSMSGATIKFLLSPESGLVQITGELSTIMYCQCRTNKCKMINIDFGDLHVLHALLTHVLLAVDLNYGYLKAVIEQGTTYMISC